MKQIDLGAWKPTVLSEGFVVIVAESMQMQCGACDAYFVSYDTSG